MFDRVATKLSEIFQVFALDFRGRGESAWGPHTEYKQSSYVTDVAAVCDALGLERFSIIGTAMGGGVGMAFAAKFPDRVNALVINDIGPDVETGGLSRITSRTDSTPVAFPDLKSVVNYYKENFPAARNLSNQRVEEYARWNVRLSDSGLYVWKMDPAARHVGQGAPEEGQLWEQYRSIQCPILVLRGEHSDILSRETASRMGREHPDATVVEIAGAAHPPLLTEKESLSALQQFLPEA
tara:strand:- start:1990 stop:2706 length:717 start_codon:yes stop_codon:yes gene_type:complete